MRQLAQILPVPLLGEPGVFEMVVMAKRAAVDLQSLAVDPLVLFPAGKASS
jgi:hypothetical protein